MILDENFELNKIPSEQECIDILKEIKIKDGFVCTSCNSNQYYWKEDKLSYECKNCNKRFSLTVGTIMEGSQVPIFFWVIALHYRLNKNTESIKSIQEKLNHNRYATIHDIVVEIDKQINRQLPKVKEEFEPFIDLDNRVFSQKINFIFDEFEDDQLQGELVTHYLNFLAQKPIIY